MDPGSDADIKQARDAATRMVIDELKVLYKQKLLPIEQTFMYNRFYSPLMTDSEFESKPMVLLIGQYSTGKTTFIRYLLGRDFPGHRIGPEPTTDRFTAVLHGPEDRVIPGNALCVSPELPFRGLERFGTGFLNHFEGSQCESEVLENITLIDSPGILAGRKQGERGYDFKEVCQWFAERCDLILLLFDAHKLDISDEFQATLDRLKGHEDKIRCVLNKADQIDRQRLMRVYGALMWGMGKVLRTPEVLRVYIGSFWDQPLVYDDLKRLFSSEENELMQDLRDLPRNSAVRKINELVKRARLAKVNAHIISYLKSQMPSFMGQKKKQEQLIADLGGAFRAIMKQDVLSPGDFPDMNDMRQKLMEENFANFPKLTKKHLDGIEELLASDIPRLMEKLPKQLFESARALELVDPEAWDPQQQTQAQKQQQSRGGGGAMYKGGGGGGGGGYGGGAMLVGNDRGSGGGGGGGDGYATAVAVPVAAATATALPLPPGQGKSPDSKANPFAKKSEAKANPFAKKQAEEEEEVEWAPRAALPTDDLFQEYGPVDGKLSGDAARPALVAQDISDMDVLFQVWELADYDGDGNLDAEEFALAIYLCKMVKNEETLPAAIPPDLIPPSQR